MYRLLVKKFMTKSSHKYFKTTLFMSKPVLGFFADPFAIRIWVLKVRIRPLINLLDLNDGFDKALEEPDQKGQC